MAEWVNVFEKAVRDMKAERLNVGLKSMGWYLFEKSNLTLERQERALGAAESEYEFAAIRGALIKLFPDTIISQEKRSVPDRKPGHVSDWKPNDRFKNRFRKSRDGKSGRYTAHETDARDTEEDPNSEKEGRVKKKQTQRGLSNVKWMSGPRWWKNWKTRQTDRTWKICESFQSPCTKDSPPSVRHTQC